MRTLGVIWMMGLLLALAGCGASVEATVGSTTTPAESAVDDPTAWQAELGEVEREKISRRLWLWLDGDSVEDLQLVSEPAGNEEAVAVSVTLTAAATAEDVNRLSQLGLEARLGEETAHGTLTRDGMLDVARDGSIGLLSPVERATVAAAVERVRGRNN
jgi:hypothetical protein